MKPFRPGQELLKCIACLTMLADHIGATIFPNMPLRIIGRLAFPIYCFLLSEGVRHTKNPTRYGIRLLIGMLLSELPFDLLFYGHFTWTRQSVMLTLLLAFGALLCIQRTNNLLFTIPFVLAAELFRSDYGGTGVLMCVLFFVTAGHPQKHALQVFGLCVLSLLTPSAVLPVGRIKIPVQLFCVGAMPLICRYSGKRRFYNKGLQTAFYLFYPAHMVMLLLIQQAR